MPGIPSAAYGFPSSAFDPSKLPDFDTEFIDKADIEEFAKALSAPESLSITALNDWRPVHQRTSFRSYAYLLYTTTGVVNYISGGSEKEVGALYTLPEMCLTIQSL